ncbi:hypothetical protein SAMN04489729_7766 [Amycolatopsis lurida]|uniref:Uncharacterized protein n=1 Tax=Amycolatopsis lurida NRRL 2430 TaxID=1460371 RepID=A0A2P2FKA5_AMYLU|nr:hypothetical protein [Amycolatopsis lurida]KFU77144.1 hypothetical protein BB31_32020 [Amycolatopsis lurida NRRL 2430]SEE49450.1 hypothetical protein SAMN04489729_7766 [Amycolatopsis lurida]
MTREGRLAGQTPTFTALGGKRVDRWAGVELALREDAAGTGPHFADPDVPCLQLYWLQTWLDDGTAVEIGTYQDDDGFGLHGHSSDKAYDDGRWNGIYRWRSFPELPTGWIDRVTVFPERHFLAEVHFRIGARPLALVAGELEETHEGGLIFQRLDESVLAFTDLVAFERVPWNTARQVHPAAF